MEYSRLYPIMGFEAHGAFNRWWVHKTYRHNSNRYNTYTPLGHIICKYYYPRNLRTGEQQGQRSIFYDAIKNWQNFNDPTKDFYNQWAKNRPLSGYNRYISLYLQANKDMIIYWKTLEKDGADTSTIPQYIASPYFTRGFNIQPVTWDGWLMANETWTRNSETSITKPSDTVLKYQIGDKIKFTQHGSVKYFYVIAITDTLIIVRGNGSVVVEDTDTYPITSNFLSHVESPYGFPVYFTYTSTKTPQSGTYTSVRSLDIYFKLVGNFTILVYAFDGNCSGTPTYIDLSLPINAVATELEQQCLVNNVPGRTLIQSAALRITKIGGNWNTGAYSKATGMAIYKIS